ncbi:MAG TPA: hypothetical protein DCM28_16640 [Phycisphaerales bacterium]|nr:hypothetical protein [Phycisphaerales bacterium]HCD32805.1 hypothetical protein [Phycisphaerales bacterium]|tara:strand:+ start:27 stop:482 length:456 start_codon:yes stop_codon:yes gene_type:complete
MSKSTSQSLINQLNALLSLEHGSLIRHLSEAQPHISVRTWQAWNELSSLEEHRLFRVGLLSNILVENLNAQPLPVVFEQTVGFAHFLTLDAWLPQIREELEKTRMLLEDILPTHDPIIDSRIQELIRLCMQDLRHIELADKLVKETPSTLS